MLTDKGPTFYYVGLTGIKEDGRPLPIPESFFFAAGALVDSGTVITRLPPKAYSPLRSAFAKAMEDLGYKKAPGVSILDTCYDLEGGEGKALPAVSMAFQGGASLDVDASGILYMVSESRACLGFAPNKDDADMAIIGNTYAAEDARRALRSWQQGRRLRPRSLLICCHSPRWFT